MPRLPFLPSMLLAAICVGCGADQATAPLPADDSPTAAERPAVSTPAAAEGELYVVDPASSEVFWRISKAGMMARFGHNHVISAETFSGTVRVDPDDPAGSSFELEIPVADLVIDDPELRARFGEEFASVPSDEDKAGTRRNMLGDQLLDADDYPVVRVRGNGPAPSAGTLPVEIEILGKTFDFDLPAEVVIADGTVEASGEFALDHAELGLTPFSALGGALQVGPTIEFTYRIRAVQAAR